MKIRTLFIIAFIGIFAGLVSVWVYNEKIISQRPTAVSYNPYQMGIYATGIVESYQGSGSNINIYPEVSGRVINIYTKEGQTLNRGDPILMIDYSVQSEIVKKDVAQVNYAQANLVNVTQQLEKINKSYSLYPQSISKNTLDNAVNAVKIAKENLNVAIGQYKADKALLDKYVVKSPVNGMIFRIATTIGSYISPQGSYDTYSQSLIPAVQMGIVTPYLQVRCYLDEILVPRLPSSAHLTATLFVRGLNNVSVPLEFISIQPYTIPKIQLSDERLERIDVRVLPILFRFKKPVDMSMYPGQLVDIYIKGTA